jgi:hypothetical protein
MMLQAVVLHVLAFVLLTLEPEGVGLQIVARGGRQDA